MTPTTESENVLKKCLTSSGFSEENIDLKLCLEAFKRFTKEQFDCSEDALLWETGTYNFTGEDLFSCSFVRQFVIDRNDEYDHMEQLHLIIYFKPSKELNKLNREIWTYEFDDDFEAFFEKIEHDNSYLIPLKKYHPVKSAVIFGEV